MIDPTKHKFPTAQIEMGVVCIEIYPMFREASGDSRLIQGLEEPDFYDVHLRPFEYDDDQNEPYGEWEDLTIDQAVKIIDELAALNPGIETNWIDP